MAGLLDKAEAWTAEKGIGEREIIETRLAPDMLPFAYQVKSAGVHSFGAIEAIRKGEYLPDGTMPFQSFETLRAYLSESRAALAALTPDEVNGFIGRDMCLLVQGQRLNFPSADVFLLSFSVPNFMFHAATTYNILRMKGLEIGKQDFLGALPLTA